MNSVTHIKTMFDLILLGWHNITIHIKIVFSTQLANPRTSFGSM